VEEWGMFAGGGGDFQDTLEREQGGREGGGRGIEGAIPLEWRS
jgi:hypothetical protein